MAFIVMLDISQNDTGKMTVVISFLNWDAKKNIYSMNKHLSNEETLS